MQRPRLYLSRDVDADWLSAIEVGSVDDGQPAEHWLGLSDQVGFLMASPFGPVIGFCVKDFSELDLDEDDHEPMWSGPRFDVPVLGLRDASAAEVCLAARAYLDGEPTINRVYFHAAVEAGSEDKLDEALPNWRMCLEAGDLTAHYGLGYTLHELGRHREAYRHLRAYTEITPSSSWAWCWLGYTCTALGELGEARGAYRRALEREQAGGEETDAGEWLERLDGSRQVPSGER
ncbi:MAG: tetratricopeptide repeat protein [Actinomycetota bacterium]|nr:tetratricopeptide repeat protein [Actinomycetota bacterium]